MAWTHREVVGPLVRETTAETAVDQATTHDTRVAAAVGDLLALET
jgi:hypothetical protein